MKKAFLMLPTTTPLATQPLSVTGAHQPDFAAPGVQESLTATQQRATALYAQRNASQITIDKSPPHKDKVRLEIHGVPHTTALASPKGIWRHYTDADHLGEILARGELVAGTTGYVYMEHSLYREDYPDLTGVFLTRPEFSARAVGVNNRYFVDLELPEGAGLLDLSAGIFLVPGTPRELRLPIHIVGAGIVTDG